MPIFCALLALSMTATVVTQPSLPARFAAAEGTASWPGAQWYHEFGSDELDSLLKTSATNSLDIAAAEARVRQAVARARGAKAALRPQVDAGVNANRVSGRAGGTSATETDWSALLSASYELDFWGKNRATAASANASARGSAAERDTVAITTAAAIANTYFEVLSLREREVNAAANLGSTRDTLNAIEARFQAGVVGAVEAATQRAAVAAAELVMPDLKQQEMVALGKLALLTGHDPEGFEIHGQSLGALHMPALSPGLPAELLTRRPDLMAAESNLAAAKADVAAARAALLPTVMLNAAGGIQNPAVQAAVTTLSGTGGTLTIGASLVQTLFDGGRRRALRATSEARAEELLIDYRSAIRNALLDVETSLSATHQNSLLAPLHAERVMQSERAAEIAQLRYRAGSGDFLTLLDAQRSLFAARDAQNLNQLARLQAAVDLARALGGGWQANP
jgi:NodT family efflux transporter outer membrane factor (OMF) lipoprotein